MHKCQKVFLIWLYAFQIDIDIMPKVIYLKVSLDK